MKIETIIIKLTTDKPVEEYGNSVRGYLASLQPENVLLHQHQGEQLVYSFPKIQYKVIGNEIIIFAIKEGIESIQDLVNGLEYLNLQDQKYEIIEKNYNISSCNFGIQQKQSNYRFITTWLGLNADNVKKYNSFKSFKEKKKLLEGILIANIISVSKAVEYIVSEEIICEFNNIKPIQTYLKGIKMLGFKANFSTNFNLPNYLGLGKSVSRGFGTIIKV